MNRFLTLASSAALALAVAMPAAADAPQKLTLKTKAPATEARAAASQRVADMPAPIKKSFHEATSRRAAAATPSLRRAMTAAGAMRTRGAAKAAAAAEVRLPELCGMVTYMDSWAGLSAAPAGLFQIKADGGLDELFLGPDGLGGVPVDGYYYTSSYGSFFGSTIVYTYVYDMATGEEHNYFSSWGEDYDKIIFDFATDPATGTVYGLGYTTDAQNMQLSTVEFDPNSGITVSAIGILPGNWNSIACGTDGQLYGISYTGTSDGNSFLATGSTLCKIDKTTAAVTEVGATGYAPQYLSSATIDPRSGKMYWTVCPPSGEDLGLLCEVNLTTGAATKIVALEENAEIQGLYIAPPAAEDGAPAEATALEAVFDAGSLSGTIKFDAPATTYDGTPATGQLSYTVLANGEQAATGTTQYGAAVSAAVTLPASGAYTFAVTTANATGTSPVAKLEFYAGFGVPASTTATLDYVDDMLKLTWTPVTTSVDGGYFDAADVTYTVTRYPGEVKVYEGTATSYSEAPGELAGLTKFYYTVVATSNGMSSAPATSNAITLGAGIVPPYDNTFDTEADLEGFTVIDANNDARKWLWANNSGNGEVRMTYNSSMDMDDWLITPPIKLQGGKLYNVSFVAHASGSAYAERVEAKWGTDATAAAMTRDLVAPTVLTSATPVTLGNLIVPASDGTYYIGIHGISDKDKFYLYIDDLSISAPQAATIPAAATDLTVTPAPGGDYKATVAFKAPALDMAGNPLAELTKIELSRDGELIHTFESPAIGAALSYDDVLDTGGDVTYTVVGYNTDGMGAEASASAFIGVGRPAAPTGVTLTEEGNTGYVTVTWNAVSTDINGSPIDPSRVTYAVCYEDYYGWAPLEQGITGTSFSLQAVPEGRQEFVQYAVFAITEGGNTGAITPLMAVGTPYDGMDESFANGDLNQYIWGLGFQQGASWDIYEDDYLDIPSSDYDNGYAAMRFSEYPGKASLFSGKITLPEQNAGVSFHALVMTAGDELNHNAIQLYVKEPDTDWAALDEPFVMCEMGEPNTWAKGMASLDAYAGKVVQLRFEGVTVDYTYTFLDQIYVGSLASHDLGITAITAPGIVATGAPYTVDVAVANIGIEDAEAITVTLFADGEKYAEKTIDALASGEHTTVSFEAEMGALATEAVAYYATLACEADVNPDNDISQTIEVAPKFTNLPAVADLTAESGAAGVELAWSEPDLTAVVAEPETVDFEDGTNWAHEYAGWTFVDVDGDPIGGIFTNWEIPGTVSGTTPASFIVFDYSQLLADGLEAHSGNKYLASIYLDTAEPVDDWAISPELTGDAQTISFWAKSAKAIFAETVEMYYSTGSLDPADFVKVDRVESVPEEWTKYSFDVPAGAKHFAVRSCSADGIVLLLDDFTFTAAGATSDELSIVGYDVYRDGRKINDEPVEECEYTDTEAADGEHSYVVVTVYTIGISAPSNVATVEYDGIADATAAGISITAGKGTITVAGAEGKQLTVAAADGKLYFNGAAAARQTVAAPSGIYVVKAGTKIAKVAVK